MKCKNCGTEFTEGNFCPECGLKVQDEEIFSTDKEKSLQEEQTSHEQDGVDEKKNKIPFYFSGWFILVLVYLGMGFTLGITYIVGLILSIRRFKKFKEHKKNNRLILGAVIAPIVLVIIFSVVEGITDNVHSKKIAHCIKIREYDEALNLIDKYYIKGSQTYDMHILDVYEAQGDYDGAAVYLLDALADDEPSSVGSEYMDKLKSYLDHTSENMASKLNEKIDEINVAAEKKEAEEKAKKEAEKKEVEKKEAEEKAKKEAVAQTKKYGREIGKRS